MIMNIRRIADSLVQMVMKLEMETSAVSVGVYSGGDARDFESNQVRFP